jgi:tRNA/rRNA methyltransferase
MTLAFSRIRYVLSAPSHPGNVGSAARAAKTMGFDDLWLANPKTAHMQHTDEAIALASGAADTLANIQTADTLAHALAPITLSFALTARPRDLGPPACDIRQAAILAREHLLNRPDGRVAVVLGCERSGLSNAEVAQCQYICHIPANPLYSSLNIAQALQLAAWEMRYALIDPTERLPSTPALQDDPGRQPASQAAVAALLKHWQEALIAVQFLDPERPKKLVARMQHLFNRSQMTQDEVDMMRGVCTAIISSSRLR